MGINLKVSTNVLRDVRFLFCCGDSWLPSAVFPASFLAAVVCHWISSCVCRQELLHRKLRNALKGGVALYFLGWLGLDQWSFPSLLERIGVWRLSGFTFTLFNVSRPWLWLLLLKTCYDVCVVADPDLLWGQILKMLNSNMPEEFYLWISNLKQTVEPLLERVLGLLQTLPWTSQSVLRFPSLETGVGQHQERSHGVLYMRWRLWAFGFTF